MKIVRVIIWLGFIAITLVFFYYGRCFKQAHVPGIVEFEFAQATEGKALLQSWGKSGLLVLATKMIWLDFAYIFCYVSIIMVLSTRQIRSEPSVALNALLRANFFFAILAGLLDVVENSLLLYNVNQFTESYISTWLIAGLKFILIGWVILIWLISFVKSKLS